MPKRDDGQPERADARPTKDRRADLEANAIGAVCAYELVAILLRKTRWTKYVPPLSRFLHRHWLIWESFLHGFRLHFINYGKEKT